MRRWIFAGLGVFFVGVAAVGVFLPGVPTVGPLILASVFLTKSSPRLERKLIRNRLFARYLHYLDGTREMPMRTRLTSIALMWTSVLISATMLRLSDSGPVWLLAILVVAGAVGTVFIMRYARAK